MSIRFCTPTRLALALALGPLALVAPRAEAQTAPAPEPDYRGEAAHRVARVRTVEGEVRIHKGEAEEALERGLPVAEGDRIDSRGRGVLQLGDGSRVAFGAATRFQVAALFGELETGQAVLRLDQGRLRLRIGADSRGRLRVDTPAGTATLEGRGDATLSVEGDHSVRLRVHSGRLAFANDLDRVRLAGGERLTVYGRAERLDRVAAFSAFERDAFDGWCERALEGRRGASWDRLPEEIRAHGEDLDGQGEWVDVPEVGWCWRPLGLVADWRPYWRGRWGAYAGGLTWIGEEPWSFLTFHFGRWGWRSGWGWHWIPGRRYSPAWVAWDWNAGYCGWAPLDYWNAPCTWGYGAWGGGYCWNLVLPLHLHAPRVYGHIRADRGLLADWRGHRPPGPWRIAPLGIGRGDFRDPGRVAQAFDRHAAVRPPAARAEGRVPFEDRRSFRPVEGPRGREAAPGFREGRGQAMPSGRPQERAPGRVPMTRPEGIAPRERMREAPRTEPGRDRGGYREPRPAPGRTAPAPGHAAPAPSNPAPSGGHGGGRPSGPSPRR